jgi:hypothetical protein
MPGFTEDEYQKELTYHHITVPPGTNPSHVYSRQKAEVKDSPKSGVFRDFMKYGVYPARVVVQYAVITVPFLVSKLDGIQLTLEIANQRNDKVKKDDVLGKRSSTPDEAYKLIKIFKERNFPRAAYTPALQRYMSALNFYFFVNGGFKSVCTSFLTPQREDVAMLLPLVDQKLILGELRQRNYKDPTHWGDINPGRVNLSDVYELLIELMTSQAYDSKLREIMDWFKIAFVRQQLYQLMDNVLQHKDKMIAKVTVTQLR